ncbi:MAG: hypothetical protein WCO97_05115 [bacterium]
MEPAFHASIGGRHEAMLLASRIVKADQSDVTVEFGDAEISPDLLSNALFREFALAFDIALPTWPTVLADDGILPCLLLLAPIENMQIIHEAGSAVWEITVREADFLARLEVIRGRLTDRAVAKRRGATAQSVLDALVRPLAQA